MKPALLIANDPYPSFWTQPELRTDPRESSWDRISWYARDGDVLVVPRAESAFLDYATSLTGTRRDSLVLLAREGATPQRLLGQLREALSGREIGQVLALSPEPAVADLVRSLGLERALPGHAFLAQGGGALVNSKAAFRAVAEGNGIPVPPGTATAELERARDLIAELFDQDHAVMLKRDHLSGGRGNELLSPKAAVVLVGAKKLLVLSGRSGIQAYLKERWDWYTDGGRYPVIVEQYFPESRAVFAEFWVTDEGAELLGEGQMFPGPARFGEIIPIPGLEPARREALIHHGRRLCDAVRAMGYRGFISADAILTPGGELLFTEYNGRPTGSTHVYEGIGKRVVGPDYAERRVLFERIVHDNPELPPLATFVERLAAAGLAYDRRTRKGVVLTNSFDATYNSLYFCIVEESVEVAKERERELASRLGLRYYPL